MLLRCFSKTWFNLGEFTLFWRKLQNVAKYAFLVLLFWAKIFICAIFYAYSISAHHINYQVRVVQKGNWKRTIANWGKPKSCTSQNLPALKLSDGSPMGHNASLAYPLCFTLQILQAIGPPVKTHPVHGTGDISGGF